MSNGPTLAGIPMSQNGYNQIFICSPSCKKVATLIKQTKNQKTTIQTRNEAREEEDRPKQTIK